MTQREPAAVAALPAHAALWAAVTMLIAALVLVAGAWRPASASSAFTQQTGLPCTRCHVMPPTGNKLTPFGEEFKKNGNKVKQ